MNCSGIIQLILCDRDIYINDIEAKQLLFDFYAAK